MDKITLSFELVNKVLGYLGTRPYQEVFQLVEGIQRDAGNQPPKDTPIEVVSE